MHPSSFLQPLGFPFDAQRKSAVTCLAARVWLVQVGLSDASPECVFFLLVFLIPVFLVPPLSFVSLSWLTDPCPFRNPFTFLPPLLVRLTLFQIHLKIALNRSQKVSTFFRFPFSFFSFLYVDGLVNFHSTSALVPNRFFGPIPDLTFPFPH